MSTFRKGAGFAFVGGLLCILALGLTGVLTETKSSGASVVPEMHSSEFQRAFFEAARVYGKAGCGDQSLAEMTAEKSIQSGVPAQLIAAMAATESTCNPLAVSNRGAIGLTQVMPKIWKSQFDFSKINLFNPKQNMEVSTQIVGKLIKEHGLKNGLSRYYGTGADDIGLGGAGYAAKVLQLAGRIQ